MEHLSLMNYEMPGLLRAFQEGEPEPVAGTEARPQQAATGEAAAPASPREWRRPAAPYRPDAGSTVGSSIGASASLLRPAQSSWRVRASERAWAASSTALSAARSMASTRPPSTTWRPSTHTPSMGRYAAT